MSVELKVGQVWKDRNGRKVTLAANRNSEPKFGTKERFPFIGDNDNSYMTHGAVWGKKQTDEDLIELVQDENGWRPWVATAYSQCPVAPRTLVRVRGKGGTEAERRADTLWWHTFGDDPLFDPIVAYKIIKEAPEAEEPRMDRSDETTPAVRILQTASNHMRDRAATYDKPEGERSMGKTVEAFNAVTGRDLSESEGWLLLQILKDVRLFQRPGYHADSAEDCVAYAALKAEAKMAEVVSE